MPAPDDAPIDLRLTDAELEDRRATITSFIGDRVDAADADRAVIGLSGGVDSSLTATLAVEAVGASTVHGLVMPSEVSGDDTMSDAERVAEDLGIEYDVIEINPFVDRLIDAYPDAAGDETAVGNARARTRAVLAYLVANHEDAIVLGTGNRTEALVGYFTKYGDGAVDCHPIGNLYKQQVRQLARHLGVRDTVIERAPSAELWAGQTDEDELGMDYDTLDAVLALTVDGPVPTAATARLLDLPRGEVERIRGMHAASEHKRSVPPAPHPVA